MHSKRLLRGIKKYEQRLKYATDQWENRNIKNIGYADIHTLLVELEIKGLASKYRKDIRDTIKTFYRWCYQCGEIKHDEIPKFPMVKVSMPYRKIIDKATQKSILDEIYRLSWNFNPRIYIGILFLSTYINLRPGELIKIKEKDIDLENGRILIRYSKTGNQKYVFLLEEDIQLLTNLPKSFPELYVFRHVKSKCKNHIGSKFGDDYLYRWWRKACNRLRITGVPLYPGTRHSTAVSLRGNHTPEEIRRATGHRTASAFDRYLEITGDELRAIYAQGRGEIVELKNGNSKNI